MQKRLLSMINKIPVSRSLLLIGITICAVSCCSTQEPEQNGDSVKEEGPIEYFVILLHRADAHDDLAWMIRGRILSEAGARSVITKEVKQTGLSYILLKATPKVTVADIKNALQVLRESGIKRIQFLGELDGVLCEDTADVMEPVPVTPGEAEKDSRGRAGGWSRGASL